MSRGHLVLLHGWAGHSSVWSGIESALADNFDVLNVNLPGYDGAGKSSVYDPADVAEWLRQRTPPAATWLVWSAGALPALRLACGETPHIARLNAVAPVVCFEQKRDWPCGAKPGTLERFRRDLHRDSGALINRFARLVMHPDGDASRVGEYRKAVSRASPSVQVLESGLDVLALTDYRTLLGDIAVPVTIFQGRCDKVVPPESAKRAAAALCDARVHFFDGCGHAPFITDPDNFLVAFENHGRY